MKVLYLMIEEACRFRKALDLSDLIKTPHILQVGIFFFVNERSIPFVPELCLLHYERVVEPRTNFVKGVKEPLLEEGLIFGPSQWPMFLWWRSSWKMFRLRILCTKVRSCTKFSYAFHLCRCQKACKFVSTTETRRCFQMKRSFNRKRFIKASQ